MDDPNSHDNRIIVRRVIRNEETGATEEEIFRASRLVRRRVGLHICCLFRY